MTAYTNPHHKQKHQPGAVRRHRAALAGAFFINGAVFANWASRIPAVQTRIGLGEQSLGLALLGLSVGVLLALPVAGGLIARFSSRTMTAVGALGIVTVLPFLGIAGSFWALWATLFMLGISTSLMDVAMNAQAVEVERLHGKPIMSSFHAAFSIGSTAGAGLGALFAWQGVVPAQHFLIVALFFGGLSVVAARWLVNVVGEQDGGKTVFALPPRTLWTLGVVAFCAAIGEGAMADWSALYLRRIVGVGAGLAGLGFAVFSLAMTVGRLTGDWLTARFNPVWVVRGGGAIAAIGMGLALLFPVYNIAIMGMLFVGLGLSTIIPLAFSSAGNRAGISSGTGIAGVATIAYSGFLAGPPFIGMLAEKTSLRVALSVLMVLFVLMMFMAGAVRRPAA